MQVIRSINHNAAIGFDSLGREVVVMGRGVGFGKLPRDIPLAEIERTFVGIDPKYFQLIADMPYEYLSFAAQFADVVRVQVSHELSSNLPITLADHIAFMVKRAREGLYLAMPLAEDVAQSYPVEFRLGKFCVQAVERTFNVRLPRGEAVGVALSIAMNAVSSSEATAMQAVRDEQAVDRATRIIEREFDVRIDRDSFDYARFSTHVRSLLQRMRKNAPMDTSNRDLISELRDRYPATAACVDEMARTLVPLDPAKVTEEERMYLLLHTNRILSRAKQPSKKSA